MGRIKELFKSRTAKICLLLGIAVLLLLALWRVFGKPQSAESAFTPTPREERLMTLLEEIDGVESVTAMIAEEEGRAVSVVIVFGGEDDFLTRSRVVNVAAAALGIAKEKVQIYPAQNRNS